MINLPIGTVLTSSTKTTSFSCQSSSSFLSNSPSLRGVIRFCRSKNHHCFVKILLLEALNKNISLDLSRYNKISIAYQCNTLRNGQIT